MNTNRELQSICQVACLKRLPGWHKRRSYGLYRRNEDFVQWIIFETSRFSIQIVPHYAVQALAEKFPTEALTLGRRVRDQQGSDLWIQPNDWETRQKEIVDAILIQTDPASLEKLDAQKVTQFLNNFGMSHVSALTTQGIAVIMLGNVDSGRKLLQAAADWYQAIDTAWANQSEKMIRSWLVYSSEQILDILRKEAQQGADLLRLP